MARPSRGPTDSGACPHGTTTMRTAKKPTTKSAQRKRRKPTDAELARMSPELRRLVTEQARDDRTTRVSRREVSIHDGDVPVDPVAVRAPRPAVPRGYAFETLDNGTLTLTKTARDRWETDLPTRAERDALDELVARLDELRGAEAWEPEEKRAIGAAYGAIFGHAPGARWVDELRRTLTWQLERRADAALRRTKGLTAREREHILSATQIVALVRQHAPDAPDALTSREVAAALDVCTLGRGGGRGKAGSKSVDRWVDAFVARLASVADGPRKPRGTRSKRRPRKTRR